MNSFCLYCCGGDRQEINQCVDKSCPFYSYRQADLDWQVERQLAQKILEDCNVICNNGTRSDC